jgi:type IV pilus assembly protein PilM
MAKSAPTRKLDIGLDLTSNELRCVALSKRGKEIILERFAIGEIPTSVFAAGRVAEPHELGARIKALLHENGIAPQKAIISLSGKAAITRVIELPKMGKAQTRQAISLQINQYVPFPPGDTVYDYKVLPPREGGKPAMQEVLLVATRATAVDSLIATLRAAGINCDGIKITSLAAWNIISNGLQGYTQAVGLIDLRDTVTDLSFFLNGQFRLSRPVELGYNSIIGKVAQLLGVTTGEAEEYIKADPIDLTIPEDEIDPTEDNRMREALLSVFSNFVSELIRSIRYYESQAQRHERVGKLLLFGTVGIFPNIAKYLEDQTGLEVAMVNLSSLVQYRQGVYSLDFLDLHASKLPVACGLALEAFNKSKELNLMPASYYTNAINRSIVTFGLLLLVIMGVLGYTTISNRQKVLEEKQTELANVTAEATKLAPDANDFDRYKGEVISQQPRFNQIMNLFKNQRVWPEIMDELGRRTNDQVWLEAVDFEASDNKITMTGRGVDRTDMLQFAINLDKSPYFTNTVMVEKTDGGGSGGAGGSGGSGNSLASTSGASTGSSAEAPGEVSNSKTMQGDYKLPRWGFQPGATIEDFFRRDYSYQLNIQWKFDITTELQTNIIDQSAVVKDVIGIEEVIQDVINT